jgi:hypothetical protein
MINEALLCPSLRVLELWPLIFRLLEEVESEREKV